MNIFIISQLCAGLAICFDVASFQFRERHKILFCFLASSALLSIHFGLLNQPIGQALYALTFFRFLTGFFTQRRIWLSLFIILSLLASLLTYRSPVSLLALSGSIFSTIGAFQSKDLRLRQFMLAGTIFWMIFNLIIFSPVAVMRQALFIGSNVLGLFRFYSRHSTQS